MTHSLVTCGFIGLGSQGAPIAHRIIGAHYPTVLWARRPQTLDRFRDTPAVIVESLAQLGSHADHVGICVSDDQAVQEVCDELMPSLRPGSRVVIHSTTHPKTCKGLALEAARRGLLFVEAPVSGGAPAASAGKLTVMVGGTKEAFEAARPILETFATLIVHVGKVGTAQAVKLINNTLMAAQLGLAHSAAGIAQELGLDRKTLLGLLSSSSARSYALEVYARQTSLADFANAATLVDKARLLCEMLGPNCSTATILWNAARPLAPP
jgi:3-hydroxyisobutyrate dehydrogenase-like beta-hydroxyacid dehydrogenase